jgi:hypothetical protein
MHRAHRVHRVASLKATECTLCAAFGTPWPGSDCCTAVQLPLNMIRSTGLCDGPVAQYEVVVVVLLTASLVCGIMSVKWNGTARRARGTLEQGAQPQHGFNQRPFCAWHRRWTMRAKERRAKQHPIPPAEHSAFCSRQSTDETTSNHTRLACEKLDSSFFGADRAVSKFSTETRRGGGHAN